MRKRRAWEPKFIITPAIARRLMEIEAARAVIESRRFRPRWKPRSAVGPA